LAALKNGPMDQDPTWDKLIVDWPNDHFLILNPREGPLSFMFEMTEMTGLGAKRTKSHFGEVTASR
jgi:hypothetical protein